MTSTRYFLARIGQAFGIHRRQLRLSEAAAEMHLLKDAEAHLGHVVWKNVEHIEEVSVEYWNLRRLVKERETIAARLAECEARLREAHDERASLLSAAPATHEDLAAERTAVLTELDQLTRRRDEVVQKAREVRRSYDGLKMKLEVLAEESTDTHPDEELTRLKNRLTDLKQEFSSLKEERLLIAAEIEKGDARLDAIDTRLESRQQDRRSQASEAFHVIGEANREISGLRAEIGLIDSKMRQLHSEIGRYISYHAPANAACKQAAKSQLGLIEIMRALRHSIALNHRLAGES